MSIWNSTCESAALWRPLLCASWRLCELPIVFKKDLEVIIIPRNWISRPRALDATCDGVFTFTFTH